MISRHDDIVKSPNDKRAYRGLVLKNEMKVLIVSDPETDKSAASLDVNIGCMNDPVEIPGVAHFCEHLLFMGTKKYPEINDYMEFLSRNAGYCNAYTGDEHTNYYFEVDTNSLKDALDRLAQFFICPLFLESTTEKELNAVHHEYEKNLKDDIWRYDQFERFIANPEHPWVNFGCGNRDTLEKIPKEKNINVRKAVLDFHQKWYSANLMSLSVVGKETLDELQETVVQLFSDVVNKEVKLPTWQGCIFGEEQFRYKWYVLPEIECRTMNIEFQIPDYRDEYRTNPVHYWSRILNHQGEGSLHKYLRDKGWANGVSASGENRCRGYGLFLIHVDFTIEGLNHADEVLVMIYQYLNMIKREDPLLRILEEYKNIAYIDFRFQEKGDPVNLVKFTAGSLRDYPIEELLIALSNVCTEWKLELISSMGKYLLPEKMRVTLVAKEYENENLDCVEPYFGTKFKKELISSELLKNCQDAGFNKVFHFPKENIFIPTVFDIKPQENIKETPIIIKNTRFVRMWFKQDDQFLIPKANLQINFECPLAKVDPINTNLTSLYVAVLRDSLNELYYEAALGGLSWYADGDSDGINLSFSGYDEKIDDLLKQVLEKILNLTIDDERFVVLKQEYFIGLKNFDHNDPTSLADYHINLLLMQEHNWSIMQLRDCESFITVDRLRVFVPELLTKMYVQGFLHGNVTISEASKIAETIESFLDLITDLVPLQPCHLLPDRSLKLPEACHFWYEVRNKHHETICTQVYYQVGILSMENKMLLQLFVQISYEPCFDFLRTKEQLGYDVVCSTNFFNNSEGLSIYVLGSENPVYLEKKIEEFVQSMDAFLDSMTEIKFEEYVESLATIILEKPTELSQLTGFLEQEITSQRYMFDRKDQEVKFLRSTSRKQLIDFYREHFKKDSSKLSKLVVHVVPEKRADISISNTEGIQIHDPLEFRNSLEMFPNLKSNSDIPKRGIVPNQKK